MKLPVGVPVYRADGNQLIVSTCRFTTAMETAQLLTHFHNPLLASRMVTYTVQYPANYLHTYCNC